MFILAALVATRIRRPDNVPAQNQLQPVDEDLR